MNWNQYTYTVITDIIEKSKTFCTFIKDQIDIAKKDTNTSENISQEDIQKHIINLFKDAEQSSKWNFEHTIGQTIYTTGRHNDFENIEQNFITNNKWKIDKIVHDTRFMLPAALWVTNQSYPFELGGSISTIIEYSKKRLRDKLRNSLNGNNYDTISDYISKKKHLINEFSPDNIINKLKKLSINNSSNTNIAWWTKQQERRSRIDKNTILLPLLPEDYEQYLFTQKTDTWTQTILIYTYITPTDEVKIWYYPYKSWKEDYDNFHNEYSKLFINNWPVFLFKKDILSSI